MVWIFLDFTQKQISFNIGNPVIKVLELEYCKDSQTLKCFHHEVYNVAQG